MELELTIIFFALMYIGFTLEKIESKTKITKSLLNEKQQEENEEFYNG